MDAEGSYAAGRFAVRESPGSREEEPTPAPPGGAKTIPVKTDEKAVHELLRENE